MCVILFYTICKICIWFCYWLCLSLSRLMRPKIDFFFTILFSVCLVYRNTLFFFFFAIVVFSLAQISLLTRPHLDVSLSLWWWLIFFRMLNKWRKCYVNTTCFGNVFFSRFLWFTICVLFSPPFRALFLLLLIHFNDYSGFDDGLFHSLCLLFCVWEACKCGNLTSSVWNLTVFFCVCICYCQLN